MTVARVSQQLVTVAQIAVSPNVRVSHQFVTVARKEIEAGTSGGISSAQFGPSEFIELITEENGILIDPENFSPAIRSVKPGSIQRGGHYGHTQS